jgi:protein phosphatase
MDICVDNANRAIFNAANTNPQYAGMGTTLVVAVFREGRCCWATSATRAPTACAGPAHADHPRPLAAAGADRRRLITPEQAAFSANKNLVTRAVGVEDTVLLETHQHECSPAT